MIIKIQSVKYDNAFFFLFFFLKIRFGRVNQLQQPDQNYVFHDVYLDNVSVFLISTWVLLSSKFISYAVKISPIIYFILLKIVNEKKVANLCFYFVRLKVWEDSGEDYIWITLFDMSCILLKEWNPKVNIKLDQLDGKCASRFNHDSYIP